MNNKKEILTFSNVTATYDNGSGVFDISFAMKQSEMIFLMGPTGSGKSTLLKTVYRELDIDKGDIIVDGQSISSLNQSSIALLRRDRSKVV